MSFLITGFSASGTMYTAEVLQRIGYDVRHEMDGGIGTVSWRHLPRHEEYDIILHQVRHPLKVLGSAVTGQIKNINYILSFFEDVPFVYEDKLHRVMYTYINWTEWADKVSHYRYKIEDFDGEFKIILDALDLDTEKELPSISKLTNTHSHKDTYMNVTVDDLYDRDKFLARDILDQALLYGYDL